MRCDWVKKNLSVYMDGEINLLTGWKIKKHLKKCYECHKEYTKLKKIQELTKAALFKTPDPGFYERLQMRLPQLNRSTPLKETGSLTKIWISLPLTGKLVITGIIGLILFLLMVYPHLFKSSLSINKFEEEYLRSKEIFSVTEEPNLPLVLISEER